MHSIRLSITQFVCLGVLGALALFTHGVALWPTTAWFAGGLLLGSVVMWFDEFIAYPRYHLLDGEQVSLVSRSTLFLVAYVPLALFLLTSSGSLFAMGLILGIGVRLALEMLFLRHTPAGFTQRFLQLRRSLSPEEIEWISYGFSFFVVILALLTVL